MNKGESRWIKLGTGRALSCVAMQADIDEGRETGQEAELGSRGKAN